MSEVQRHLDQKETAELLRSGKETIGMSMPKKPFQGLGPAAQLAPPVVE